MLDSIKNFIADRLLAIAKYENIISEVKKETTPIGVGERLEGHKMIATDNQTQDKETKIELAAEKNNELIETDFVKVEKNLIELGFFSPVKSKKENSSKKVITINRTENGNKVEAKATIVPVEEYGRPTIADQDKYLALQKLIVEKYKKFGEVKNPIIFSSSELLAILGKTYCGKNIKDIVEWLDRMYFTSIVSEGAVYLAGKKIWAKDRFRVFDRAVSAGKEVEPGQTIDKNAVWFSDWQLQNINNNYLLSIDIDSYQDLKHDIAKALVPYFQIWFFASREEGKFEKLYIDICEQLGITCYKKLSYIKQTFCPSLDELKKNGYLKNWELVLTSDKKNYKIIFYHGEKFYQDRVRQLTRKQKALEPAKPKTQKQEIIDITPEPPAEQPSNQPQPQPAGEIAQNLIPPQQPTPTPTVNPEISPTASTQPSDNPQSVSALSPAAQSALYELINAFGVTPEKALALVTTKLAETKDQLAAFKYRYPKEDYQPRNKAGAMIDAIETSYQLPDAYLADKKKQEEQHKAQEQAKIQEACTICKGHGIFYVKVPTNHSPSVGRCFHNQQTAALIRHTIEVKKYPVTTLDGQPIVIADPIKG